MTTPASLPSTAVATPDVTTDLGYSPASLFLFAFFLCAFLPAAPHLSPVFLSLTF